MDICEKMSPWMLVLFDHPSLTSSFRGPASWCCAAGSIVDLWLKFSMSHWMLEMLEMCRECLDMNYESWIQVLQYLPCQDPMSIHRFSMSPLARDWRTPRFFRGCAEQLMRSENPEFGIPFPKYLNGTPFQPVADSSWLSFGSVTLWDFQYPNWCHFETQTWRKLPLPTGFVRQSTAGLMGNPAMWVLDDILISQYRENIPLF